MLNESALNRSDTFSHLGRKAARVRELCGMKQEALAASLGISQQSVSKIEQSEKIDEDLLEKVANVLGVPTEGIRNFSDGAVIRMISNNCNVYPALTVIIALLTSTL